MQDQPQQQPVQNGFALSQQALNLLCEDNGQKQLLIFQLQAELAQARELLRQVMEQTKPADDGDAAPVNGSAPMPIPARRKGG